MAWCFITRASVATALTTHPCVPMCLRVKKTLIYLSGMSFGFCKCLHSIPQTEICPYNVSDEHTNANWHIDITAIYRHFLARDILVIQTFGQRRNILHPTGEKNSRENNRCKSSGGLILDMNTCHYGCVNTTQYHSPLCKTHKAFVFGIYIQMKATRLNMKYQRLIIVPFPSRKQEGIHP